MRASVPASVVDNTYEEFPRGNYDGKIASAKVTSPNDTWTVLKLGLSDVTAREGTEDPGRTRYSGDITITDGDIDVREVEDFSNGKIPFGIRRAAGLLAGLGEGLGVAQRENGRVYVDFDAVIAALESGDFEGERIGFEVTHYKTRNGDTRDQLNVIGPAS